MQHRPSFAQESIFLYSGRGPERFKLRALAVPADLTEVPHVMGKRNLSSNFGLESTNCVNWIWLGKIIMSCSDVRKTELYSEMPAL